MKSNKKLICKEGFTMSVQAHSLAYCNPRNNNAEKYLEVEVGYPSEVEELLLKYAEDPECPTDTIYAYVPVMVVTTIIAKHGGIVQGDLPPCVIYLKA